MFSVIIPLYNKGVQIKRAIDSVLSQSIQNFEIVVIDDGSKDNSAAFVRSYSDTRVKYYYKTNGGVSSARNLGVEKAVGDWIIFLDADDEMRPDVLGYFDSLIKKYQTVKIFIGQQNAIRESKQFIAERTKYPHFMMWMNAFYPRPGAVLAHKSVFGKIGGFDVRQSFYEDLEFGLRILNYGPVVYFNQQVVSYNQDGSGLSCSIHPIEKEMAYYIPEHVASASFWHKALLYENLEMEIVWWQQRHNEANVRFYRDMQTRYFGRTYQILHWVRQKMKRRGLI